MKRLILGILLCVLSSGCVSSQIIPNASTLLSIRTINVVPIEAMPLIIDPDTMDDMKAINALMQSNARRMSARAPSVNASGTSLSRSDAPLEAFWPPKTLGAGAIFEPLAAALAGREVPGENAVIEMGQPVLHMRRDR